MSDVCATCGASIDDTISGDTTALYLTELDVSPSAWACSTPCADAWLNDHPVISVEPTPVLTISVAADGSISDEDAQRLSDVLDNI